MFLGFTALACTFTMTRCKLWVAPRHVLGYSDSAAASVCSVCSKHPNLGSGFNCSNQLEPVSYVWGGGVVAVAGKISMMPMALGTADL